jgi:hypothetical protein
VGLSNLFKLAKLTIKAFEDIERKKPLMVGLQGTNELEVMYNPETLATKHANVSQKVKTLGGKTETRWLHSASKELTVTLVFDGTNVSSFGIEQLFGIPTVSQLVKAFLDLTFRVESQSHQPAFLTLIWGTGVLGPEGFECRLDTVDIQYTLFDRDGSPLRAQLTAKFIEAVDSTKKSQQLRLASPDLTHHRVVRAGETLPLLCLEIYGSAEHYLRVAAVNELDDFRELEPGSELFFPPFERKQKGRS